MFLWPVILSLLLSAGGPPAADREPTKGDIPAGLSPQLKALIEQTFSANPEERGNACKALGKMGPQAAPAVPFLLRLIEDKSDAGPDAKSEEHLSVGSVACSAVAKIGPPALDACIAALRRASGDRRDALIGQLGKFDDPRATSELASMLGDPDVNVRSGAMWVLSRSPRFSRDPRVVPAVIRVLRTDKVEWMRAWAADALGELHDPRVFDPLIAALKDPDFVDRNCAASSLGKLRDRRAVPALVEVATRVKEDAFVRASATTALAKIGDPRAVDPLFCIFSDRNSHSSVRCSAIRALATLNAFGKPRAADFLYPVMQDSKDDQEVRRAAIYAVTGVEGAKALPALLRLARDGDENETIRHHAAMCIVKVTEGAIDEVGIVMALRLGISTYDPPKDVEIMGGPPDTTYEGWAGVRTIRDSLNQVAEHGQTMLVRATARAVLGGHLLEPLNYYVRRLVAVLLGAYALTLAGASGLLYRSCRKRGRFMRRWLFLLVPMAGGGAALVVASWRAYDFRPVYFTLLGLYVLLLPVTGGLVAYSYLHRGRFLWQWLLLVLPVVAAGLALIVLSWRHLAEIWLGP